MEYSEREALGDGAESFELVYNLATKRLLIEFVRVSPAIECVAQCDWLRLH